MDIKKIRHSCAHILAAAVKELYPKTKLGIGPAIEEGFYYDFDKKEPFTPEDLKKIEKKMKEIIKLNQEFKKTELTKEQATKELKDEPYKLELLKDIEKPTFYQNGNFKDLCAGPHLNNTKDIKAFKLLRVSGAYWKGDSKNKQLQRIYGTAFNTKEELKEYLYMIQEAEKRNHVKLGKKLDLFSIHEEGPGFIFWHNKGTIIKDELIKFWKEKHKDYQIVSTPPILSKTLWEKSGHWENYRENMYFLNIDKQDFAIKPMNCPGGVLIFKNSLHSYRELPLKVAELGLVHRHELSGVLNGLLRVRAFTQDDAHIYCTDTNQMKEEIGKVVDLLIDIYKTFGFKDYEFEISTRPDKSIGTDKDWENAINTLKEVLKSKKLKFKIDEGSGVFYGPKIDVKIKDSLGRKWQCGTIQYDFNLPERFDITYESKEGKKKRPLMIHRVIYGSLERFMAILIEHYAGKFPLWLSPIQTTLITVKDDNIEYAEKLKEELEKNNIRTEIDKRSESIPKKVRDAQVKYIPLILIIGDKEQKTNKLAVRTLDGKVSEIERKKFIETTLDKINKRE